jgi:hypothetical protein
MILFPFYELREFEAESRGRCQQQQQRRERMDMKSVIVKLPILYGV